MAERGCRTLCRQLPPGSARPCDRAQRTALETSSERVHPLLPRGSNTSCAGEGKRLQAVRRRRAPKLEAGFYRCQGWAGCIIATIWQPELLSQESLVEVEDELRVRCALKPALCPLRSHNEPFRMENACQNDHQVRYSISFLSRVEFWRSTTALEYASCQSPCAHRERAHGDSAAR